MADYDPESYEEMADGDYTGVISDVEVTTAQEIFGSATLDDPEKEMLNVFVETENGDVISEAFSTPKGPQSFAYPNFKLGKFYRRYGSVPREGMEVDLGVNDEGFLGIVLEEQ